MIFKLGLIASIEENSVLGHVNLQFDLKRIKPYGLFVLKLVLVRSYMHRNIIFPG